MVAYALRRVFAMIPALLGIALITFSLMHLTRGGPFDSERANPNVKAALEVAYGLNEPLWPTFGGAGAGIWQALIGVVGLALFGVGLVLLLRARRASEIGAASAMQRQLSSLLIGVGFLLAVWWLVMLLQGPPTRIVADGFVPGQFLRFLANIAHGDLGPSFSYKGRQVTDIILSAAGNSFVLGLTAFLVLVALAIPLGVIAALRQNSWVDYVASTISLVGYSIPNFVFGVVMILVTGLWLRILPIAHWGDPVDLILPAFVLAIRPLAVLTRLTRASMLEVLHQDFIRTANSKGLGRRVVLTRHALRNALLPIVTLLGDQLGDLVTGSLVVETLFNVPGIGQYFVLSVAQRDYGLIMGTTLFYAALVLVINLAVDLLYGVIDPRVRLGAGARS